MSRRTKVMFVIAVITLAFATNLATVKVAKASETKVFFDYFGQDKIIDTNLTPGSRFTVNLTISYIEDLYMFQVKLGEPFAIEAVLRNPSAYPDVDVDELRGWDPTILKLVDIQIGPFLGSRGGTVAWSPGTVNNTLGTLDLSIAYLDPNQRWPTGGGVLVFLTFEVLGVGGTPIRFSLDTALFNRTGGYMLGPDWDVFRPTASETIKRYGYAWRDWLVDGYFDNRPQVYVSPELVRKPPGHNFTVDIRVTNVTNLHSWSFSMKWNATLLNVTDVSEGDFLKGFGNTTFNPGQTRINETSNEASIENVNGVLLDPIGANGSGTLASFSFTVLNVTGETHLNITIINMLDPKGSEIVVGVTSGFFTNRKYHDIEVTSITVNPEKVPVGSNKTIEITVKVTNKGFGFNETNINVTVYYEIDTQRKVLGVETIPLLEQDMSKTLTFLWDTTNETADKYLITANASLTGVADDEPANNVKTVEATISAHDVAITSVTTPVAKVIIGQPLRVFVKIKNRGTEPETFNVTAFYKHRETGRVGEIGTIKVTGLLYRETNVSRFVWDTTGAEMGNYTIWAEITTPIVNETNTENNKYVKPDPIELVPFVAEPLSTEFLILIATPFVAIGLTVVYYMRKRSAAKT